MIYITRSKTLPKGFVDCPDCNASLAFSDVIQGWRLNDPWDEEHKFWKLDHWHGPAAPFGEDQTLSAYCHGHGALCGDVQLYATSYDELQQKWNARCSPDVGPAIKKVLQRWWAFWS